jgi:hypothetical protein
MTPPATHPQSSVAEHEQAEPHSCVDMARVVKCDNKTDVLKCRVCGKEWTQACTFDDDYA